jgi:hypothetical protein
MPITATCTLLARSVLYCAGYRADWVGRGRDKWPKVNAIMLLIGAGTNSVLCRQLFFSCINQLIAFLAAYFQASEPDAGSSTECEVAEELRWPKSYYGVVPRRAGLGRVAGARELVRPPSHARQRTCRATATVSGPRMGGGGRAVLSSSCGRTVHCFFLQKKYLDGGLS